jgi:hypothetical protein
LTVIFDADAHLCIYINFFLIFFLVCWCDSGLGMSYCMKDPDVIMIDVAQQRVPTGCKLGTYIAAAGALTTNIYATT